MTRLRYIGDEQKRGPANPPCLTTELDVHQKGIALIKCYCQISSKLKAINTLLITQILGEETTQIARLFLIYLNVT